jgi:hypothetical protein
MATAYTSLLGLALPVTGELSGTWGNTVNTEITALLDSAIAGTTTLSSDADVTLTTTTGAANTSRQAILLWTAGGTVTRNITAPAQSKIYTVINASSSTQSIVLRGAGPTTGVTIVKGESAVCAWNGSDFIKISNTAGVGTFTNLTVTGTLGVTGVATLGNGAILGTPASGTVTNLTGTASININGTVGATTASTGAFTTLSATGVTTVQAGSAASPAITTSGDTNTGIFFPAADTIAFSEGGVEAARFDSAGNFGLGVTPSAWSGGAGAKAIQMGGTSFSFLAANKTQYIYGNAYYDGTNNRYINSDYACSYGVNASGTFQWNTAPSGTAGNAISFTQAMTLDASGNLLVGNTTGTGYRLNVVAAFASGLAGAYIEAGEFNQSALIVNHTNASVASNLFQVQKSGTGVLTLDASGNLGLGVTPSAFTSSQKAVQVKAASLSATANGAYLNANTFFNGTNSIYVNTGFATFYGQESGAHAWYTAASGTAGNTVSFTQAMTLDASGNLGIGTTSPTSFGAGYTTLEVKGTSGTLGGYIIATANGGATQMQIAGDSGVGYVGTRTNHPVYFQTNNTEQARIDSSGRLSVAGTNSGDTTYSNVGIWISRGTGNDLICGGIGGAGIGFFVNASNSVNANGFSASACAIGGGYSTGSGRSANFGGTVNASGTDYAEYMTKDGNFTVAKGDVVGINAQGKLTNVFSDAVSFVVKSTDPSYVGGDTWGSVDVLGQRPNDDATQEVKDAYEAALETARQTVDRIAFAGQVPVNVTGATAGQYIIPVNNNGAIKGEAVSNPTFEQYQIAVGKVIAIESDGRARIIVKVA